ncbi:glycerophosphodiester phosphodiesterase family protein [Roseococcus suduntuyensis]|uniref:Glycerophosphoryl diester phosphodiesterase n=1 Tax=Roseococcus suduntuyensis TaxID=455361 RepID=A0A840ACF6_9PROT|nr:glycerophosphodiester phosphodiesterase family protein [Roseococcus suduntuyensis]MBB3898183.1 glycerophosphoryl diester phosphodiesterase [Roseococcus suduntuyensis]
MPKHLSSLALALFVALTCTAAAQPAIERPLVIAHRGASQYLPEHTMEAYRLAIRQGADFIEPDLLLTADGIAVARHDRALALTTNIAAHPTLPSNIDQITFEQLRGLQATSRGGAAYAPLGAGPTGLLVPSFAEVLDELRALHASTGRIVGVYPEVKTIGGGLNTYNRALADAMLAELAHPRHGGLFDGSRGNVILQSFDPEVVAYLGRGSSLPVVQLSPQCPSEADTAAIAARADGVGMQAARANAECLHRLRAAGLFVHVYTLSNANPDLHALMFRNGVDGVFTNAPDTAIAQREQALPGVPPREWIAPVRRRRD